MLFACGRHPKDVQDRLGHSTIAITMDLYTHGMQTRDDDAAMAVQDLLRVRQA